MARNSGHAAGPTIGRTPPAVTLAGGTIAASTLLSDGSTDAVAIPVSPARAGDDALVPGEGAAAAAARYGIDLAEISERARLAGNPGEVYVLQLPRPVGSSVVLPWTDLPPRLVLVGVGAGRPDDLRRAGAALARATRGLTRVVTTVGSQAQQTASEAATAARAVAEGYLLAAYAPPRVTSKDETSAPAELVLLGRDGTRAAAAIGAARTAATATWLVRDLANTPSNTKNPEWMAEQARRLGEDAGLEVVVRGPRELSGFGGILAVGSGSASAPRLVTVEYTPATSTAGSGKHVVVVGKGITYDTGGLSIKPSDAMLPMKTDMAGAAVALAVVLGAAADGVAHRVTAVLPLAENHVGASSYRPGDVLTMFGGATVEVANTDAEGRLVLADALAWADATLDPDVLIDVATLTGAATVGLGKHHAALYSQDPALAEDLLAAGLASGERAWHMPLVDEYEEAVRSDVADLRHVPLDKRIGAGSITAALFLRHFVGSRRWAHLDIAGPARSTSDKHEVSEGATGFGARLLLRYLDDLR